MLIVLYPLLLYIDDEAANLNEAGTIWHEEGIGFMLEVVVYVDVEALEPLEQYEGGTNVYCVEEETLPFPIPIPFPLPLPFP